MDTAIKVTELHKSYGKTHAVRGISFEVQRGSIFAFLGTNGAGKSTTINCLTTIIAPDSGQIEINGKPIGTDDISIQKQIGVVFQSSLLDPNLTVRENLTYRATFYGIQNTSERIAELSENVELTDFIDTQYGSLSGGQKRRADIARALIHSPSILFLDEPTAGLDPKSREQVWQTVYGLQATQNLTVFLTTHYMEETERANNVFVIDHGQQVASGTPQQLRAKFSKNELKLESSDGKLLETQLAKDKIVFKKQSNLYSIATLDSKSAYQLLTKYHGMYSDFEFRHGTMDDVFLELTDSQNRTEK